jgi:hypothetical protein
VRLFAKAVAMECAAAGDNIRINTVHPGVIDTPIWAKIPGSAGAQYAARSARNIKGRCTARPGWRGAGHRQWRALPRLRCVELYDRSGTRDRRRHDGGHKTALELTVYCNKAINPAIRLCAALRAYERGLPGGARGLGDEHRNQTKQVLSRRPLPAPPSLRQSGRAGRARLQASDRPADDRDMNE